MRRSLLLLVLTGGIAHADDAPPSAEDARALFGMTPSAPPPASCDDDQTFGCATATDPFAPRPAGLTTWLPAGYLLALPVADATHDDVAALATGASRDDAGPAFGGATGLENTWTIEGAPVESARTGAVETRVPLLFTTGVRVGAGGFAARDRVGLGGTIEVELVRGGDHHAVDARAWGGLTEDGRERPIASASYQLRRVAAAPHAGASFATVASGPLRALAGGRAWYAAGVAGSFTTTGVTWRAARLVDADGDGLPDGLPGVVALEPIATSTIDVGDYVIPAMARAGWARGPHALALTAIGSASRDEFFLANATDQAAGTRRDTFVGDAIARWRGRWRDTRGELVLAWHRSARRASAYDDAAADLPQLGSAYVPAALAEDPALAAACLDGADDPYPAIPNCPIPFGLFASGGAGELVDQVTDRPTATAELARRAGRHVLRVGGTFDDTRLVQTARLTGGEHDRSLFPGHLDRERFFDGACGADPGSPCAYADRFELAYRTRYTAAYLEDTFAPVPELRVDAGVRWELMWVGPRLHLSDGVAPRMSVAWDVLGDGRSRWWASLGRSHALLPAGMGRSIIAREQRVRDVELDGTAIDRNFDRGNVFRVADGVAPATQDELATGFEVGVIGTLRAGAWLQRRSLRRGLETVLANPNTGEAVLDNPGRGGPLDTPARRETTTLAVELMIAPTPAMSVRASYLWGEAFGTWAGPFDPRQGAALYAGTDWDLDVTNLDGRLPSDPGHRVELEGIRRGKLGALPYTVSTRLSVASGRPRDVLADSDLGIVYLLPRGAGGRLALRSQAEVRVATRVRGVDVALEVFNLFDRQDPAAVSDVYSGGQVHPIAGGSLQDLVFVKSESCGELACEATPAQRRTAFGLPTAFRRPRTVVLGARYEF